MHLQHGLRDCAKATSLLPYLAKGLAEQSIAVRIALLHGQRSSHRWMHLCKPSKDIPKPSIPLADCRRSYQGHNRLAVIDGPPFHWGKKRQKEKVLHSSKPCIHNLRGVHGIEPCVKPWFLGPFFTSVFNTVFDQI